VSGEIVKVYDYKDEAGELLYQQCRFEPKDFRFRRPDGKGGHTWNLNGTRLVPYRLPELISASKQSPIAYTEGEKDADRLAEIGFESTTCPCGAGKHRPEYNKYFAGRIVHIFQDNDEAGRKHTKQVTEALYGIAAETKIIELPGLPERGDVSDWLDAGHTKTELLIIIDETKPYEPTKSNYPLTDAGNTERFAARHSDKLRYCPETNHWLFYNGKRWNSTVGEEKAGQLAIETVRAIAKDADDVISKTEREKILQWSLSSESAHRIKAMLSLTKNLMICHAREFDRDGFLFNCSNGTIDLKTGELREYNPDDLITKLSPVHYVPEAKFAVWDNFLNDATGGNEKIKIFLQRAIGYSLTGDTSEEKLFLIHGPTASGKSTFLEAIKSTLGDYAATADFETFIKRNQIGGARNDVARLAGTRFVVSIEVDEGRELAEGLVKLLTGGDTVSARFLYSESFEFVPSCKLWLACNHAPRANDRDDALWRRIIRIPFEHTIPEEKRDPKIKQLLRDPKIAGPAILAWAVEGCLKWEKEGLAVPDSIKTATQQYREEQDPLHDFFENECLFGDSCYIGVTVLRQRYDTWAKETGLRYTLGPQQFNARLQDRGCARKVKEIPNENGTIRPTKCWIGVTLQSNPQCLMESAECQQQEKIPF
jgi:putative DNA primase/helicase